MDNPGYIALTRVKGLADEMRVVANNVANASTTGFRAESVVFAEVLEAVEATGDALSMAAPRAHVTDRAPGALDRTGGELDLAIVGEGFFQVITDRGPRLTRAGAFFRSPDGAVVSPTGARLAGPGGGPLVIPPDAGEVVISEDGAISADGQPIGRVGLFTAPPEALLREDGVNFRLEGPPQPAFEARIRQGYLEGSNVDPVEAVARMIEVQRAYEMGQSFLDLEDRRLRDAVQTIGRAT